MFILDVLADGVANTYSFKKNVVGTQGTPTPENGYRYSKVWLKVPTVAERIIYTSLATLWGVTTGLITYFKLIQPLISR